MTYETSLYQHEKEELRKKKEKGKKGREKKMNEKKESKKKGKRKKWPDQKGRKDEKKKGDELGPALTTWTWKKIFKENNTHIHTDTMIRDMRMERNRK